MNKLFSKVAALSVGLAMAIGVGVALGSNGARVVKAEYTLEYTLDGTITATGNAYATASTVTQNGIGWKVVANTEQNPWRFGGKSITNQDRELYSTTAISANIAKIEVSSGSTASSLSVNSLTIAVFDSANDAASGSNAIASKTVTSGIASSVVTFEKEDSSSWEGKFYRVVYNVTRTGSSGNGYITLNNVKFYSDDSGETTKYDVIDRVDYGTLSVQQVTEGSTLNCTITPDAGHVLPETLTYVYMAGSPVQYTYEDGVVTVVNVTGNITIEAVCPTAPVDTIQELYSKAADASVNVYGIYVGVSTGTGPVIMDGEYGIVIYSASADVSSYTVNETILHVTGTISIYKGLYEIASPTIEAVTSVPEENVPATPVVYAAQGGETQEFASRLTTVTGVPSVSGTFPETAGSSDVTITMTLSNQKTVSVFYKKAAQTADAEAFAAVKDAVANSTEITVKGFTGWYNAFQVQMNGYVPPAENYTAEDFAQELLDLTDAVCANYASDESKFDTIKSELTAIWSTLQGDDKYPALPSDQKTILAEAVRDEEGTVVEQAMARYDFLTGKYGLSNFINGRTPVQLRPAVEFDTQDSNTMIIIIAITAVSAISLATLLVLKKKKHN